MSDGLSRTLLGAYRLFGRAAYPGLSPYMRYRTWKGKEDPQRRRERFGYPSRQRPPGAPIVWVHAASVGESAAVASMVRAIASDGITVLMTTGTLTSASYVEERLADFVIHQFVPIDTERAVIRFLDHWRPDLAVFVESEIWPTTIGELWQRQIPQVLVNARMSDRSFKGWKTVPGLAEALFQKIAHVVAQSEIDAERFRLLGAAPVTMAGNLKADVNPPPADPHALSMLGAAIAGRPVWAALSTHPGEEEIAAKVHAALGARYPGLLTILTPRHVERSDKLARQLAEAGLGIARRSLGEMPNAGTDILLGDVMGEFGLYMRSCEIAFMGKSMTGEGGQNPLEAAMLGTAILSGRYVQNFRDAYLRLTKNGGARIVKDGAALTDGVGRLLGDDELRARMIDGGRRTVFEMRGAMGRTMTLLQPFLHPLKLSAGLDRQIRDPGQPR